MLFMLLLQTCFDYYQALGTKLNGGQSGTKRILSHLKIVSDSLSPFSYLFLKPTLQQPRAAIPNDVVEYLT
jgi:hypothetical protein